MKNFVFRLFVSFASLLFVAMFGQGANVLMAAGTATTDGSGQNPASATASTPAPKNSDTDPGIASVSSGQQENPDLYETSLEQTILTFDPMGTAGLTVLETSMAGQTRDIDAQEFEFYSIGPRMLRATVTHDVNSSSYVKTDRILLPVSDNGFASKDDTIRVVGVKGMVANAVNDTKDLMLVVIDVDQVSGNLICYAKNGLNGGFTVATSAGQTFIPSGTMLVRMAKSCSESKAQTSRAHSTPTPEKGYVQNFMLQIEQTEFDKLTKTRVPWNFDDIVDWNMRDYKVVKWNTYMWGVGGLDRHLANDNENNYTMTGLWWQAGRSLEIGHIATDGSNNVIWEDDASGNPAYPLTLTSETVSTTTTYTFSLGGETWTDSTNEGLENGAYYYLVTPPVAATSTPAVVSPAIAKVEIDGKDLVAFNKQAFVGNGGSQVKYLIGGCNVIEAFDNIKGKQYEHKDIVTEDNLIVQNFKTSFGTIKLVYDKLFDVNGMANAAFMLDKQYLRKVVFKSLDKTVIDFKKSGQRNSQGIVLQEVNAVYLQYADAHAQVWLKGRTELYDYDVAGKYDVTANQTKVVSATAGNYPGGHKQADYS